MRKFFVIAATAYLLYASWVFFQTRYPDFSGISEAQALPAGLEPIRQNEIESFLNADSPRVLFLYASWCPYCQKQMEGFRLLKNEYPTDKILAISTDKQPEKLAQYINSHPNFPFEAYIYQGGSELKDFIKNQGGSFTGGIPYFAVFEKGEFKQEFLGLTHPKILSESTQK